MKPSECEKHFDILMNCLWKTLKDPPTEALKKQYKEEKKKKKEMKKGRKEARKEEAAKILQQLEESKLIIKDNPEKHFTGKKIELDKGYNLKPFSFTNGIEALV